MSCWTAVCTLLAAALVVPCNGADVWVRLHMCQQCYDEDANVFHRVGGITQCSRLCRLNQYMSFHADTRGYWCKCSDMCYRKETIQDCHQTTSIWASSPQVPVCEGAQPYQPRSTCEEWYNGCSFQSRWDSPVHVEPCFSCDRGFCIISGSNTGQDNSTSNHTLIIVLGVAACLLMVVAVSAIIYKLQQNKIAAQERSPASNTLRSNPRTGRPARPVSAVVGIPLGTVVGVPIGDTCAQAPPARNRPPRPKRSGANNTLPTIPAEARRQHDHPPPLPTPSLPLPAADVERRNSYALPLAPPPPTTEPAVEPMEGTEPYHEGQVVEAWFPDEWFPAVIHRVREGGVYDVQWSTDQTYTLNVPPNMIRLPTEGNAQSSPPSPRAQGVSQDWLLERETRDTSSPPPPNAS